METKDLGPNAARLHILLTMVGDYFNKRIHKSNTELLKQILTDIANKENGGGFDNQKNIGNTDQYTRKADDEKLLESIRLLARPYSPDITWDSLAGLGTVKQELQIAIEMPRRQPQLFQSGLEACQFILLYGPPGNGKTHLAKAMATNFQSRLYIVSVSDVTHMWVGTSARLVRLLFQDARAHKPAIIFFDEVDAVCGQRGSSDSSSLKEQKAELLAQMDGAKEDNTGILFVGATNKPWTLDSAFLRRFSKQIYIPLPHYRIRVELLAIELRKSDLEYGTDRLRYLEYLAKLTEDYSGSDIKRLVQESLKMGLRRIEAATHFRIHSDRRYYPCGQNDQSALETGWRDAPNEMIGVPVVFRNDFMDRFKKVKPSVKEKEIERFIRWTEKNESG